MSYIEDLRNNPYVREKILGNNISSFNFTSKAFYKQHWDAQTIRARGLFVNTKKENIVARSYDKFFNYEDEKLNYPVNVYRKYNGFLGIISATSNKDLFIASKSTNQGEYAGYFNDILNSIMDKQKQQSLANFLYSRNLTAVCEVIDPINDPHIVEYSSATLVLLDLVVNDWEFYSMDYDMLCYWGESLGFPHVKELFFTFYNDEEFKSWLEVVQAFDSKNEGYVIVDTNKNMYKIKNAWYLFWKGVRRAMQDEKITEEKRLSLCHDNYLLYNFITDHWGEYESVIDLRNDFCLDE